MPVACLDKQWRGPDFLFFNNFSIVYFKFKLLFNSCCTTRISPIFYNLPNKSYPPSLYFSTPRTNSATHLQTSYSLLHSKHLPFYSSPLGPRIFPVLHSNNNIINKIFQQLNFENSTSNLPLTFYPFLFHLPSHFPSLPLILSYFNIPPSNRPPLSLPIPPSNCILF